MFLVCLVTTSNNIHGWNIHKPKMRLSALLAVILCHLSQGNVLYLLPMAFECARNFKTPIPPCFRKYETLYGKFTIGQLGDGLNLADG